MKGGREDQAEEAKKKMPSRSKKDGSRLRLPFDSLLGDAVWEQSSDVI